MNGWLTKTWRALLDGLAVVAISLFLYALVDVTYWWLNPPKPYDRYAERLTSPSYIHEPYFSEEFLTESFSQPGGWITPPGTRLVWPKEFHGKHFNTDYDAKTQSTYRRTINPPPRSANIVNVLLLGGSTLYNSEVPDQYTLASKLSALLNSRKNTSYQVINAGVTSVNTAQELERLQYELNRGLRPEIVVSYNGINDIYQGIYSNDPEGVIFSQADRVENNARQEVSLLARLRNAAPVHIYRKLQDRAFIENSRIIPGHMAIADTVSSLAVRTKEIYLHNVRAMEHLSKEYHFAFIAILQPMVFEELDSKRPDITAARDLASRRTPMLETAYRTGYPYLQSAIAELRAEHLRAYDLSDVLKKVQRPVYIDFCHINSVGNEIVASAIADILRQDTLPF
jgi:lysophospholipase L1-like esterase